MPRRKKGKTLVVPASATMDAIIDAARHADGIKVEDLREGDTLVVRTKNSVYTFFVHDPARRTATASGGVFDRPTEVHILGCSLSGTGSMVRLGWIGVGYRLVVGPALLSRAVAVELNGHRVLPFSGGPVH